MGQTIQVPTQVVADGRTEGVDRASDGADQVEPSADEFGAAVATLKLLADETRLRIIWNLLHGEHAVNELAEHLAMQPAAISHHLAKLRSAGAVTTRRDGNRIYYRARDGHVEGLVQEALHHAEHLGPAVPRHHVAESRSA
jgi:ArsR family transcriptional regulator, zinc-responsive transcriptional repressor